MSLWSRRNFLKAGAAGTAGVALEAGAQRLLAPAPKPWNGETGRGLRKYRDPISTVCRACNAHCGLIACRDGDRVVQLQPQSGSPTNRTGLCPRAYAGLERVYDPDRVLKPLRRDGPRGCGRWKAISWEEALSAVRDALARSGGERVLHLGQEELLVEELRPAFGWTHVLVDEPLAGRPGPGSGEVFYGAPVLGPDLERARRVFLFGARLLDGRAGIPTAEGLLSARRGGAEIHLVDAFAGATGTFADWEAVRPGTEAAVAFGLAKLILESGSFDATRFAARVADSPDTLRKTLAAYTPDTVERVSGLSALRLSWLAKSFLAETPAVALANAGSAAAPAAALLNHLSGAAESPGGLLAARGPFFVKPLRPTAAPEAWFEELAAGRSRAAFYLACNANPAYDSPHSKQTAQALGNGLSVGFLVAMDTHLTETAQLADLFLPLATPFESWGLAEGGLPDGRSYLFLQQPVTRPASEAEKLRAPGTTQVALFEPRPRPLGEARSLSDVLLLLARGRAGEYERWADSRAFLEDLLQRSWGPGSLAALRRRGVWVSDDVRPAERTSRVSLLPFIPLVCEPSLAESLGLIGYVSTVLPRSYGNSRRGLEIAHGGEALLNRETGKRLGLKDGDRVALKTASGEGVLPVKLIRGIHPQAVAVPDGLGHWAGGAAARARNGKPEGAPYNGVTAPAELIWWQEEGPGVSYRSLVPHRTGADGAQSWDAVAVLLRRV